MGQPMVPMVPMVDQQVDNPDGNALGWFPWHPKGKPEEAPWPPPLTSGFVLVSFTGKFADILGSIG